MVRLFLAVMILVQWGCAAAPDNLRVGSVLRTGGMSPSEDIKRKLGAIGVPPARVPARIEPMDRAALAEGALEENGAGLPFWCGLPIPGKAVVCLPMAAASLIQAAAHDPEETFTESEKRIAAVLAAEPLGETVADQLVALLRRYHVPAVRIVDQRAAPGETAGHPGSPTLLETEIADLQLTFVPTTETDRFRLTMTIRSRLRRQSDGEELSRHSLGYKSPIRTLGDWTADDAELFRAELRVGAKRIAAELVDFLLLEYPVQVEPLMPRNGAAVKSLEPTLGWNPFFYADEIGQDVLSRIRNYTFDLRVAQAEAIVYERSGLLEALHRVEDSLPSCTDFEWRVKARFELDGRLRVSRWSPTQRFKTPC